MVASGNYNSRATTDYVLTTHTTTTADAEVILLGQNEAAVDNDEILWYTYSPLAMHFDGINLWCLTSFANGVGNYTRVLIKIDAGKLNGVTFSSQRSLHDVCSHFMVSPSSDTPITSEYCRYSSITFDGRDMWSIITPVAGQADSGNIFRLPLALLRH
jgi:hypothetical protein